jgi:hypothetical protein
MLRLVDTLITVQSYRLAGAPSTVVQRWASAALRFTAVCLPLLLAAGCARGGWVETHPDLAEQARLQPAALVDRAAEQTAGLQSLYGSYRLEARRGVGSRSVDIVVMAELPDRLSIELLAPTGQTEAFLKSGDTQVALWIGEEDRLYRGPAGEGAFAAALGLDLSVRDAVSTLLGRLPGWTGAGSDRVAWDDKEQRIRVSTGAGTLGWLHPVTLRFDRMQFLGRGAITEVRWPEWVEEPGIAPRVVELDVPAEGIELRLRLASSWLANPPLEAADFHVSVLPARTVELPLDVLAAEGGLLHRGFEQ